MIFLYIAASVCMALCATEIVLGIYALRAFRKWRGSVLRRCSELEAMIAAVPNVICKQSAERMEEAAMEMHLHTPASVEELLCTIYDEHTKRLDDIPRNTSGLIKLELAYEREVAEEKEAEEKGKKRDLIDEFFGVFNYGLADAMRAAKADSGAEGDDE